LKAESASTDTAKLDLESGKELKVGNPELINDFHPYLESGKELKEYYEHFTCFAVLEDLESGKELKDYSNLHPSLKHVFNYWNPERN